MGSTPVVAMANVKKFPAIAIPFSANHVALSGQAAQAKAMLVYNISFVAEL